MIVDNSTLDKPFAKEMAFVRRMWSEKTSSYCKRDRLVH